MKNLIIAFALMFSAVTFGQMSFAINDLNVNRPMDSKANIGYFMSDDIMVSLGMDNWDDFTVGARYYTGFCDNMFIQANTFSAADADSGEKEYYVSAAAGWTKALGIWKLQFEPMIVLDNIEDFNPKLAWGLRFNL